MIKKIKFKNFRKHKNLEVEFNKHINIFVGDNGVGKSTIKDELNKSNVLENYVCIDTDEVGINWWDYAGTENESKFSDDCLAEAVRMSEDKNLLFVTCMNPYDFYGKVSIRFRVFFYRNHLVGLIVSLFIK